MSTTRRSFTMILNQSIFSFHDLFQGVERALTKRYVFFSVLLVVLNFFATLFIISKVPYTEIDWIAYMEEVSGVINDHELDYKFLLGGTGPLVYPAGFVYIYSFLYFITDRGNNILRAQYIFAVIYSATLSVLLAIYRTCHSDSHHPRKFPLWIIAFLFLSRRAMSLFVLRLFNDCIQMFIMYISIALFMRNRWNLGCVLFSLSVSIKMNALLFAPGIAVLLCQACGTGGFLRRVFGICLPIQLLLGAPFLLHEPGSYLSRAFELTRKFLYKWSVNGAMIPEDIFSDKRLSICLLLVHACVLLIFGHYRWTSRSEGGLYGLLHMDAIRKKGWLLRILQEERRELRPHHVVFVLLSSNFIGIAFSRTLHYQFYVWYVYSLPLLIWGGKFIGLAKLGILIAIEMVFNIYPPNGIAASVLHASHFLVLISLWNEDRASDDSLTLTRAIEEEKEQ